MSVKPHIYKHAGLWYCRTLGTGPRTVVEGMGYTPLHAYSDWSYSRNRMLNAGLMC
jgi:hypothetical protein